MALYVSRRGQTVCLRKVRFHSIKYRHCRYVVYEKIIENIRMK